MVKSPERKQFDPDAFDIELLSGQEQVEHILDHDFMAQQLSQNSGYLSPKVEKPIKLLRHGTQDQTLQRLKMSPIELFTHVLKSKFSEKASKIFKYENYFLCEAF